MKILDYIKNNKKLKNIIGLIVLIIIALIISSNEKAYAVFLRIKNVAGFVAGREELQPFNEKTDSSGNQDSDSQPSAPANPPASPQTGF